MLERTSKLPKLLAALLAGLTLVLPTATSAKETALQQQVQAAKAARRAGEARWADYRFFGQAIPPGATAKMSFNPAPSFVGSFLDTMVVVVRGARPGPTLCITGGIHGDEINSVEIAHRVYTRIRGNELSGTILLVPAVNSHGFRTGSRYLPDRRDLNRSFPGSAKGSTASLIANALFQQVIVHCDALLDLHTGSNDRTNLPQIRTDLGNPAALDLARSFGAGVVLDGKGPLGSLRRASLDAGIPAVIYEAGLPLRFEEDEIAQGYAGIRRVLSHLKMLPDTPGPDVQSRLFKRTLWVRTRGVGGIYLTSRKPGEAVRQGDLLGTVADPITEVAETITAPVDGVIIGMAVPQVVLPGYALFHLGTDEAAVGAEPQEERD